MPLTIDEIEARHLAARGGNDIGVDTEDLSALDRGDSLEPAKVPDTEPEPVAETPVEEPEAPAKEPVKDDEPRIPKTRFDKVNDRMKAAEAELQRRDAEAAAAAAGETKSFDFDAAELQYMNFVLDGKMDEAKDIRRDIRAAERAEYTAQARQGAVQDIEVSQEQKKAQALAETAESTYTVFDPQHEDYSEELTAEVITQYEVRLARGDSRPEAMRKAIDTVVKLNDLAAPAPDPKPTPKDNKAAVKDKLEKAKQAAPDLTAAAPTGGRQSPDEIDINALTDKELGALPEATKKRLRGDFV